jgi:hypothetical protein
VTGFRSSRVLSAGGLHAIHKPDWNPGLLVDPAVVMLYRFESNATLGEDIVGGNDLTVEIGTSHTPHADKSQKRERSASVENGWLPSGHDCGLLSILDANLAINVPWKNGNTPTFSLLWWIRFWALNPDPILYSNILYKQNTIFISVDHYGMLRIATWRNGAWETHTLGVNMALNSWYHVAWTHDAATRAFRLRIWDHSAKAFLGPDATGNIAPNGMETSTYDLMVTGKRGITPNLMGNMDELVMFDGVVTPATIDLVRRGKYKYPV